jgi:hypothetical protein
MVGIDCKPQDIHTDLDLNIYNEKDKPTGGNCFMLYDDGGCGFGPLIHGIKADDQQGYHISKRMGAIYEGIWTKSETHFHGSLSLPGQADSFEISIKVDGPEKIGYDHVAIVVLNYLREYTPKKGEIIRYDFGNVGHSSEHKYGSNGLHFLLEGVI